MKRRTLKYKLAELFPKDTDDTLSPELEKIRLEENEVTIDTKFYEFQVSLGRKLTDREEDSILEILDKYTPMGDDGKYLTDILPLDYAWKIHQAKRDEMLKRFTVHIPKKE